MGKIDLFIDIFYLIRQNKKTKKLTKQLYKICKYEYPLNVIPGPLGIKFNIPLKSISQLIFLVFNIKHLSRCSEIVLYTPTLTSIIM